MSAVGKHRSGNNYQLQGSERFLLAVYRSVLKPISERRFLISCSCALLLAFSFPIGAQQPRKLSRLGVLLYSDPKADPNLTLFRQGLTELGYAEGQNLSIEYRFAEGKPQRLPALAASLVSAKPDVIFALGGDVVPAAQKATKTIPIVMWVSNDPVHAGIVASLARPGGNTTGVTLILDELAGKRLELLKEVAPRIANVAVLWNPDHADPEFREIQRAARSLNVRVESLQVRQGEDFEHAFQDATKAKVEALIVVSSRLVNHYRERIVDYTAKARLPLIGDRGPWTTLGGLLPSRMWRCSSPPRPKSNRPSPTRSKC